MRNSTPGFLGLSLILFTTTGCLPDWSDHSACAPQGEVPEDRTVLVTLSEGGAPEPFAFQVRGGQILIEGDIAVAQAPQPDPRSIVTTGSLWNRESIPYKVSPQFTAPDRIVNAIKAWEARSQGQIKFSKFNENEPIPQDYIEFIEGDGCWSYVGKIGGRQEISLAKNCDTRAATHELGHALGLWHEQSRSDRDPYVAVKWCNIQDGQIDNFRKRKTNARDFGAYDYGSIMHYPSGAFSKNWKVTLQSLTETPVSPWSNRKISPGDWRAISCLYGLSQEGC